MRDWAFLLANKFTMGKVDTTLFTKTHKNDLHIVQIYVDDFIFVSTNEFFSKEFSETMRLELEMNMMDELTSFSKIKSSKGVKLHLFLNPNTQEAPTKILPRK